jgi:hypothetical protein
VPTTNPIERPSGDQNTDEAPSVPAMGVDSTEDSGRIQMRRDTGIGRDERELPSIRRDGKSHGFYVHHESAVGWWRDLLGKALRRHDIRPRGHERHAGSDQGHGSHGPIRAAASTVVKAVGA